MYTKLESGNHDAIPFLKDAPTWLTEFSTSHGRSYVEVNGEGMPMENCSYKERFAGGEVAGHEHCGPDSAGHLS